MNETPSSLTVSTRLERIATLAREAPDMAFTTLAHHIDIHWMREAYRRTRKDGAVGVDGQSAKEYATNLEANLQSLLGRAKSGEYISRRGPAPKQGRSVFQLSRTKYSNVRSRWCLKLSTSRTFWTARTASGPRGPRTMH
jgi:hypothetical protein